MVKDGGKLVVLGGGESGVGAAVLGKQQGWKVQLTDNGIIKDRYKDVLSQFDIPFEEGKHSEEALSGADLVVKSPGIPEKAPPVVAFRAQGVAVISEIELAGYYSRATMIGITGSNGKTTTTLLLHHILQKAGLDVGLAGNVGQSLAMQVAEGDRDYFVVELSSFQLDGMTRFKADIAILLNITPDHLDRYENQMALYVQSKFRIAQNQTAADAFIYCADDPVITGELQHRQLNARHFPFSIQDKLTKGAYLDEDDNIIYTDQNQPHSMSILELALQGKHNIYNTMAAGIAARILEIRKEIIRDSMSDFQNIEHRLEYITTVHGIRFINDSKATNVNSTWYALETVSAPVIWILGGVDKGNDYSSLVGMAEDKVKAIICLGRDNDKIREAFQDRIDMILEAGSMAQAVGFSYQLGSKGDTVLLSPACASFD
ncbi:MAG: UDP-N-acetylmuramoyl-L-alanine--D-glutamate ligase, partial [Bacteroidota bacterium]